MVRRKLQNYLESFTVLNLKRVIPVPEVHGLMNAHQRFPYPHLVIVSKTGHNIADGQAQDFNSLKKESTGW
jgi:hypothetical protein